MKRFLPIILPLVVLLALVLIWALFFRSPAEPTEVPDGGSQQGQDVVTDIPQWRLDKMNAVVDDPLPNDRDRDGISNDDEVSQGLDPDQFDTDGDGLDDKSEIDTWGTDPTVVDTDGDGFSDGWEVIHGYNPAGDGSLAL